MKELRAMLKKLGLEYKEKKSPAAFDEVKEPWYNEIPFTGFDMETKEGFVSIITHGPRFDEGTVCETYVEKYRRSIQHISIGQAEAFLKCVLGLPVEGDAECQFKAWLRLYDSARTKKNRRKKKNRKDKAREGGSA
jgi:hypothetical protein